MIHFGIFVAAIILSANANGLLLSQSEISSFMYGNRRIRIWPSATNGPQLEASQWNFRYDPLFIPVVDENNELVINIYNYGSTWSVDFMVSFDNEAFSSLGYSTLKKIYRNGDQMLPENIVALPVKKLVISMPHLLKVFPDISFASTDENCPRKFGCWDFSAQPLQFRITINCDTRERAVEVKDRLQKSQFHYQITTYARRRHPTEGEVDLEPISGLFDLSQSKFGVPLISPWQIIPQNFTSVVDRKMTLIDEKMTNFSSRLENYLATNSKVMKLVEKVNLLSCESGWSKYCESGKCNCYRFFKEDVNWTIATSRCEALSAKLVSIHSSSEGNFTVTLGSGYIWTGLDTLNTSNFRWSDGSTLSYANWESGEPAGGECVSYSSGSKQWEAVECSRNRYILCKKSHLL